MESILQLLLVGIPVLLLLVLVIFTVQGAPFVRTRPHLIEKMISLSDVKKGERAVDLGSGDGTLVIALAQKGALVDGFEINPYWVWRSRRNIKKSGLESRVTIYWRSFWSADLSSYDVVLVYGIKHIMGRLEKKLQDELPVGSRVVSNYFSFPTWKEERRDDIVRLYKKQ